MINKLKYKPQLHPDKVRETCYKVSPSVEISDHFINRFLTRKGNLSVLIKVVDYIGNNPFLKLQQGTYLFKKDHYCFVVSKNEKGYNLVTMLPKNYKIKHSFQVMFNEMNIVCYKNLG